MKQIDGDFHSGVANSGSEEENVSHHEPAAIEHIVENPEDSESDGEPFNVQVEVGKLMGRLKASLPQTSSKMEEFPYRRNRYGDNTRPPRLNRNFRSDRFHNTFGENRLHSID